MLKKISIAGRVVNDVEPSERDIAMVFQNYALYPHMTVFDNMAYGLKIAKVPVAEIQARGMKPTSSAVSLLSGVHRKDLRTRELGAAKGAASGPTSEAPPAPLGLIGQIVGRWMSDPLYLDGSTPRVLRRGADAGSFDHLVQGVSTDVGPRAVLEEMLRLNVVRVDGEDIELDTLGMVPRGDFAAMAEALGVNLSDHAAAACANLVDGRNRPSCCTRKPRGRGARC